MSSRPVSVPVACLAAMLLAACASAPSAPGPEKVAFAPSLNVELGAMQRLPSGVYVRDLRVGEGEPARAGREVAVHFVGWLPDGTQFDALTQPAPPVAFRLGEGRVIRGWDEGLAGMRPGGQRMLVVPPALGYGRQGTGRIPPGAVLVFVVDMVRTR